MKKNNFHRYLKYFFTFFLVCFLLFGSNGSLTVHAYNLDEILDYTIEVTPYEDGSLDMTYHITWKVLDSTSAGPLEWVKIGIPNRYVEDIEALSSNIYKISYYQNGGDYIRIDFDRSYYAGDVIEFDFRFHQHRMYQQKGNTRVYTFTPGWFDDIVVDSLTIYWDSSDVTDASGSGYETNGNYCWTASLDEGEKYTFTLTYPENAFTARDNSRIETFEGESAFLILCLVCFPLLMCLVLFLFRKRVGNTDYYNKHKGMGYVYAPRRKTYINTRHRSGGGGCACACACACAGGGRAGCSKKDFYGTKLETKKIKTALTH